jgi:hypothetical protein
MIDEGPRTGKLEVSRVLTDAMEKAGVHPAYVYAVRQCGFVLTDENRHTLTDEQIAAWDAAMDRWFVDHPETRSA